MKTPTDNPRRPSRPTRRFSAMQPATRRPAPAEGAVEEPIPAPEALAWDEAAGETGVIADADPAVVAGPVPVDVAAPARKKAKAARPEPAPSPSVAEGKSGDEARIAKVMSRAGLCSRRDAEAWILAGRVAVNGVTIESPALNVGPADQVTVDGYPIDKPEHTRLFMFHKTRGLVTTARDPEGRPTIYDALPEDLPRLMTIGRLDINTEGLLLLTNDGGLARLLELPATGWLRRYRVRANGRVDQAQLDALAKGITVDGVDYAGIDAKLDRIQGANIWLTLGLREGKNREVKRVLEHLGLAVTRLIRISFGPFQLGDLAENAVDEVRTRILRDQLGTALAKQAGLDFGPVESDLRETAVVAPPDPRRKTSRSATADRKGRPVPVERISNVDRSTSAPAGERTAGPRKPRAGTGSRNADARPSRGGERFEQRPERGVSRAESRPGRTLRQADAEFRRSDAEPRREPRGGDRDGRPPASGLRRDAPRPTGDRSERPAFRGRSDDRADVKRSNASRPRTGRVDERSRDSRSDAAARPTRGAKGGPGGQQRDGAAPRRPGGGGKPPFKGGGGRPDGAKPQRPGGGGSGGGSGGGRGRPRG
jgi:23S rRNA pseudouridine2605 synthase